jgi:hypothetical protein
MALTTTKICFRTRMRWMLTREIGFKLNLKLDVKKQFIIFLISIYSSNLK